ncbi:MAG: tRNA (adenosine(37)-N6)-threonylcarbamoyltransferase complex ATPase subunit type 1 TsaE [Planctomycetaceae bacterium]
MKDTDGPDGTSGRTYWVASEADTDTLGRRLADAVEPGLVVGLVGDLGAGKTRLVRAIATALGADPDAVNSPTFVLIQRYEARLPVFHFDTYRLRDADEFADLGPDEYFDAGGVCFVEWADRVVDLLPDDRLNVEIRATGATTRLIRLTATGPSSRMVLDRVSPRP